MQELINKATFDHKKLKSLITQLAGGEISKISEVCYYPSTKADYKKLLYTLGLKEKDITEFKKRLWAEHPARGWNIHNVNATVLLIFIIRYFLAKKDREGYFLSVLYLLIRFYASLMSKNIPHCNPDYFRYALENLTRTHLFVREGSIANGILYLARELSVKWENHLNKGVTDSIAKFITETRHRISQSIKSFAKAYYAAHKAGAGIGSQKEPDEDDETGVPYRVLERGKKAIDEVVRKITVYKFVDKRAMVEATKITRVNGSVAILLVAALSNLKFSENIKIILQQFIKDIDKIESLCGDEFYQYVQKLMAVKRTKSNVYFKQQVNVLLELLIKNIKQETWYEGLTAQTRFSVNSFLAFYICLVFRNAICQ